jgi:response regulator RpfG family c-di-GMP phosphodiesterase
VIQKILLITGQDDAHRRPLLEAQGYRVKSRRMDEALNTLKSEQFELVLVNTENGIASAVKFCHQLKSMLPEQLVAIVANRSEDVPGDHRADVIIRVQYNPAKFIGAINTLLGTAGVTEPAAHVCN